MREEREERGGRIGGRERGGRKLMLLVVTVTSYFV